MTAPALRFTLRRVGLDLVFRRVRLASRSWEHDRYLRVRLEGAELGGFDSPGCDDHVRLFLPAGSTDDLDALRASPSREYTPVAWGPGWLDLDVVLHGDDPSSGGLGCRWAATAPVGAPAGVGGPRGTMLVDGTPDAWFLAGDETAVPAIRRFTAGMRSDARGHVVVEVADPAHELVVDAPPGVEVSYLHRGHDRPGTTLVRHLDGLAAADRPAGDVLAFVAAEQSVVRPARALLVDRWGLDADRLVAKGYWKLGDDAFHAPH